MRLEPQVPPWGPPSSLGHNLRISKIQVFYEQVCTRTPFKCRKCYSPTSRQGRVLVIQASVAVYLQDSPSRFFSYNLLNARKWRSSYRWAMYKGNFSSVLNQEFPFLGGFTSSGVHKRPISFEVLAPAFLFPQGSHVQRQYRKRTTLRSKSSTVKVLLYAPDPDNHEKGTLSDRPQLSRISSMVLLCCWGHSRSKIWHP